MLLLMCVYLITCRAVLFNRVRLGRVVDFTGLPVYWFTGFINLSVLLCQNCHHFYRICVARFHRFNRVPFSIMC